MDIKMFLLILLLDLLKYGHMKMFVIQQMQENASYLEEVEESTWLSKADVMEILKISDSTYYVYLKVGYIKPMNKKGEARFCPTSINDFIRGRENNTR